jgi:hypothetical protein
VGFRPDEPQIGSIGLIASRAFTRLSSKASAGRQGDNCVLTQRRRDEKTKSPKMKSMPFVLCAGKEDDANNEIQFPLHLGVFVSLRSTIGGLRRFHAARGSGR